MGIAMHDDAAGVSSVHNPSIEPPNENNMITMFGSIEQNKKKFQKPNILRRQPKTSPRPSFTETYESRNAKCLVTTAPVQETISDLQQLECIQQATHNRTPVNVESFFNIGGERENIKLLFENGNTNKRTTSLQLKDEKSQADRSHLDNNDLITLTSPTVMSAVTTLNEQPLADVQNQVSTEIPSQHPYQILTTEPIKFKCEEPNCNKEFRSEQKLKKHKNTHNKDNAARVPRQITVECPVKKIDPDGTEKPCGRIYLVRDQLVKHLNEDHTPEEAGYKCSECGRQFFWATALRAHVRSHWTRGVRPTLACGWPGCDRVFTLPCRLREHARAHTGDRPYPCRDPGCGASFRSASKLERHARRHRGLRRHVCTACGRAFLRREHLRDHQSRYHTPANEAAAPPPHRCPHADCEQSFRNMSTLYMHMKKIHGTEKKDAAVTEAIAVPVLNEDEDFGYILTVECVDATDGDNVAEARAARTHCPWPLPRSVPPPFHDEDAQPEQPEETDSNIYTVRSDLFLHGNVLINEDSEHMPGGSVVAVQATDTEAEAVPEADSEERSDALVELGLLDAHPNIDLMQEELMYTVWL